MHCAGNANAAQDERHEANQTQKAIQVAQPLLPRTGGLLHRLNAHPRIVHRRTNIADEGIHVAVVVETEVEFVLHAAAGSEQGGVEIGVGYVHPWAERRHNARLARHLLYASGDWIPPAPDPNGVPLGQVELVPEARIHKRLASFGMAFVAPCGHGLDLTIERISGLGGADGGESVSGLAKGDHRLKGDATRLRAANGIGDLCDTIRERLIVL